VVVDRNCHKSILHSIIMTGAIPVFLMPTRNHFGIIGPIPQSEFSVESIQAKIAANPLLRAWTPSRQAARADHHAVHLRRRALQHRDHQGHAGRLVDTLHFDEAWLPHAAFHDSTAAITPWEEPRPAVGGLATQSIHKLLAGISQASHVLVQDSQTGWTTRCSTRRT
jgi:arginine/lysine/ornithine decarboxylase